MYQEQRLEKILTLLEERGNLSVKEMVDALGVSKDTVRRDFDCLSQRNLAQRTHGGILPVKNTTVLGFQERQKGLTEDKKKMADLAISLVKDQSLLFFDVSTLMLEVSQKLTKSVTVYSHSLDNALVLSGKEGIDFHLLGGRFYSKNRFYYSLHEAQLLQHLRFDLAFFGAAVSIKEWSAMKMRRTLLSNNWPCKLLEPRYLLLNLINMKSTPNISWARLKTLTTGLQIRNQILIWSSLLKIK